MKIVFLIGAVGYIRVVAARLLHYYHTELVELLGTIVEMLVVRFYCV